MIVTCRRAAELTSRELDTTLTLGVRLAFGTHRLFCTKCRRFRTQLVEIDRALRECLTEFAEAGDESLPHESKVRIKHALSGASTNRE